MKRLIVMPFAFGCIASLGMLLNGRNEQIYYRIAVISAAFAVTIGSYAASRKFASTDRLFLAWILVGTGSAVAGLRYLMRLVELVVPSFKIDATLVDGMIFLQYGLKTAALIAFVLAWRAVGLPEPGSRTTRTLLMVASAAVAILVGAYPLLLALRSEVSAVSRMAFFVATVASMIGVVLIVPLAIATLALRGGLLMHAWVYLAGSEVVWLLYDVSFAARPVMAPKSDFLWGVEEGLRVTAILFVFIASLAQRRALR